MQCSTVTNATPAGLRFGMASRAYLSALRPPAQPWPVDNENKCEVYKDIYRPQSQRLSGHQQTTGCARQRLTLLPRGVRTTQAQGKITPAGMAS
jgi:hypothetical protein